MHTRAIATGLAMLASASIALVMATPAQASSYRYWTYWHGANGAWEFSSSGPATYVPADGSVEGWHFTISESMASADARPSTAPSFSDICSSTPAVAGSKRVALVIDPGSAAIAPEGQSPAAASTSCIVIDPGASGFDVMKQVVAVRTEDGLVCALDNYPTGECAPILADDEVAKIKARPSAAATATATPGAATGSAADPASSPVATVVVVTVLVAAAAAFFALRRRHGQ